MEQNVPLVFQTNFIEIKPTTDSRFAQGRARVFYKGLNRNGSYITPEFAEKLITTSIGCPVVGLWDSQKQDFTNHDKSDRKRAYGFVPSDPEFSWEKHIDEDGIEREYACFNIVLWTKAFEEAKNIIDNPLSMELNPDSICGTTYVIQGRPCFMFTEGDMLGFCVLGKDVTPCFEGASFFSLQDKEFLLAVREHVLSDYSLNTKGDNTQMENDEFTIVRDDDLSGVEPHDEKEVKPVEEFECEKDKKKKEDYSTDKDEEEKDKKEKEDSKEEEKKSDDSKEDKKEDEKEDKKKKEYSSEEPEKDNKIDMNNYISNEEFDKKVSELNETIYSLKEEVETLKKENEYLKNYKLNKIKEEKKNIVSEYSEVLSEDEINQINVDEFSIDDLNDKLAAMAYRKVANKQSANFKLIKTDFEADESDDISKIMKKYI